MSLANLAGARMHGAPQNGGGKMGEGGGDIRHASISSFLWIYSTSLSVCVHMFSCVYVHIRTHTHSLTHTLTHTHTHTHTRWWPMVSYFSSVRTSGMGMEDCVIRFAMFLWEDVRNLKAKMRSLSRKNARQGVAEGEGGGEMGVSAHRKRARLLAAAGGMGM